MLYVNNDLIPGEYSAVANTAGSFDYIEYIITGATASI